MNRIELIGAPAIGKSTLLNNMINERVTSEWKTVDEKKEDVVSDKKNLNSSSLASLISFYTLKFRIFNNKKNVFINYLFNTYENDAVDRYGNEYHEIMACKINELKSEQFANAFVDAKLIKFYYKILVEDILIMKLLNINDYIVYDEGIIHNLGTVAKALDFKNLLSKLDKMTVNSVLPKAVIHCELSLSDYYERRLNRIKNEKSTSIDRYMDEGELYKECEKSLKRSNDKVNTLIELGVPVLVLKMDENIKDNAIKANDFLSSIIF
ncbi:MAG: hypothetical protein JJU16_03410 [Alkalibacterium sp.]|nr:hypothetical protein [Alkalibacterium sp.]